MKKGKYTVRFNLSAGKNFMKWKVSYPSGVARYYEPSEVTIMMSDCKLVNRPTTANKIHEGANKEVCAWVQCADVKVLKKPCSSSNDSIHLRYNPRVLPFWNVDGVNIDKTEHDELFTSYGQIRKAK